MKFTLTFLTLFTLIFSFAQEPFQDGKKWGISKYGDGDVEGDSVIVRAEYDEIETLMGAGDYVYIGLRNDEWVFLTSNKLLNQQRYESITLVEFDNRFAYGTRSGYIDIIDMQAVDFLIRGVKATTIYNGSATLDVKELIMTQGEKGVYGVVNVTSKKEILKVGFTSLQDNRDKVEGKSTFLAYKNGENFLYTYDGTLLFSLKTECVLDEIISYDEVDNCFRLVCPGKKRDTEGMYDSKNKWFIPPIYNEITLVDNLTEVAIVTSDDGKGLYFSGKLVLPAQYIDVMKSDREGYVAIAVTKKEGEFYVAEDGALIPKRE